DDLVPADALRRGHDSGCQFGRFLADAVTTMAFLTARLAGSRGFAIVSARGTALDESKLMVSTLVHALHTLVSGLLRRTWLLALVAVIVCSAFAARAVAALVEADYLAPPTHGTPPHPAG